MRIFTIILLLLTSTVIYGNSSLNIMFDDELLKNPIQNKEQLEKMFNYTEIEIFKGGSFANTVILENGYARSKIINSDAWEKGVENRKVTQIDIIFTKYPFKKEDWITNYHKLLAARLNELFALDPSLNNKDIKWNLVLQTDCKTASLAKQYFHGILIKYEIVKDKIIELPKDIIIPQNEEAEVPIEEAPTKTDSIPNNDTFTPDYTNTRVFKKLKKKPKSKLKDLPKCPDYK